MRLRNVNVCNVKKIKTFFRKCKINDIFLVSENYSHTNKHTFLKVKMKKKNTNGNKIRPFLKRKKSKKKNLILLIFSLIFHEKLNNKQ